MAHVPAPRALAVDFAIIGVTDTQGHSVPGRNTASPGSSKVIPERHPVAVLLKFLRATAAQLLADLATHVVTRPHGIAPAAGSKLLTVDFGSPTGRIAPATLWGIACAAPQNRDFALCADPKFLAAAARVAPSLLRLNSNAGVGSTGSDYWSDAIFANGVDAPNWTVIENFTRNAAKFITPSCRLIIGVRLDGRNPSDYASMCAQIVQQLKQSRLNVWGIEVGNENDALAIDRYCDLFNAAAGAVHAIDPAIRMIGPVDSWCNGARLTSFAQACGDRIGAVCFHSYRYGMGAGEVLTDAQLFNTRSADDMRIARAALADTAAADAPIFIGEYNVDFDAANEVRQQRPVGAVFAAYFMLTAFQTGLGLDMGALWELFGDGQYGVIREDYSIGPQGRLLSKAAAVMGGAEVSAQLARSNALALAITDGGKVGVMIVNYGALPLSGPVALNRMPRNADTINRWEMSSASRGVSATIRVRAGMTDTLAVPPMSVVMLHS